MKYAIVLKVAAVAVVAGLAGCQDLKPLQADVADLKSQVAKLQSETAAANSKADQASSTAASITSDENALGAVVASTTRKAKRTRIFARGSRAWSGLEPWLQ